MPFGLPLPPHGEWFSPLGGGFFSALVGEFLGDINQLFTIWVGETLAELRAHREGTRTVLDEILQEQRSGHAELLTSGQADTAELLAAEQAHFEALTQAIAAIQGGAGGVEDLLPILQGIFTAVNHQAVSEFPALRHEIMLLAEQVGGVSIGVGTPLRNALNNVAANVAVMAGELGLTVAPSVADVAEQLRLLIKGVVGEEGTAGPLGRLADAAVESLPDLAEPLAALAELFTVDVEKLGPGLAEAEAGQSTILVRALPIVIRSLGYLLFVGGFLYSSELASLIQEQFPGIRDKLISAVRVLGSHVVDGASVLHSPMQGVMGVGAELFMGEVERALDGIGRTTPENVMEAAIQIFKVAGAAGMSAHLAAVAAETIVPLKHLGLPQLAAFLTDSADFRAIAQNSIGAMYRAALAAPARRRANARFRPELPGAGTIDDMFVKREIDEASVQDFYAQQGWTEGFIDAHLRAIFRGSNARELALVFEDGNFDDEWGVRMLQRAGFSDDDATKLLRGVHTRALKSQRQELLSAAVASYADGLLDVDGLTAVTQRLGMGEKPLDLLTSAAALKRRRDQANDLKAQLIRQAGLGQIAPEDVAAGLRSFGFDPAAADQAVAIARLTRGEAIFREEEADRKAAVRRMQSDALQAAKDLYRRFVIGDAEFVVTLEAHGFTEAGARVALSVAQAQRIPVPRLADVLTVEAQAQLEARKAGEAVLAQFQKGLIPEAAALGNLVALGFTDREARAEIGIVTARLVHPVPPAQPPTPTEQAREARRRQVDAAVADFRAGRNQASGLRAALIGAGEPVAAVDAIVQREVTRRGQEQTREADADARREALALQRSEEEAAVAAFRAGRLDNAGLLSTLLAVGVSRPLAESITRREEFRRAARPPQGAA